MNIKGKIFDVKTRRWLYRIGIAAGALLVAYGLVDENVIGMWGILFAAILGHLTNYQICLFRFTLSEHNCHAEFVNKSITVTVCWIAHQS